jgi:heme exporter protein B
MMWHAVLTIFRKDLTAEFRSRELLSTMGLFAVLSLLVFSFALELDRLARDSAVSGVLWMTMVFAVTLGLNRSLSAERELGNLDAILLSPVPRAAVFIGKAAANFVFSLSVALVLLPLMTILYNSPFVSGGVVIALLLGLLGICGIGTLLAAMTVQARARDALLPIVLLPAALPIVLAGVNATNGALAQSPPEDWTGWITLLLLIDLIYLFLSVLLFPAILED